MKKLSIKSLKLSFIPGKTVFLIVLRNFRSKPTDAPDKHRPDHCIARVTFETLPFSPAMQRSDQPPTPFGGTVTKRRNPLRLSGHQHKNSVNRLYSLYGLYGGVSKSFGGRFGGNF